MMKVVMSKADGETYQVLDERGWGYRLLMGRVAQWFRKDLFTSPMMVPSDD